MKALKICLIGNANNNDFAIARHLKDLGHHPEIYINYKATKFHFWPDKDSYYTDYTEFVHHRNWVQSAAFIKAYFSKSIRAQLKKDLEKFDLIIGNDMAPALGLYLKTPIFFLPTGSDIRAYSVFHGLKGKKIRAWLISNLNSYFFQKGIKKIAGIINTGYLPEVFERLGVSHLCTKDFSLPIVYKEKEPPGYQGALAKTSLLKSLKDEGYFLIFSHGRHRWNEKINSGETKGNEKLIKAISILKKRQPNLKLRVVFFEYGSDVKLSKELIKDLNIEEYFLWFSMDYRKNILSLLSLADLGVGQLDHIAFMSGVVNEFLACGVPVAQHINPNLQNPYKNPYPYIQIENTEDLANKFIEMANNPSTFKELGAKGEEWFKSFALEEINKMLTFYSKLNKGE